MAASVNFCASFATGHFRGNVSGERRYRCGAVPHVYTKMLSGLWKNFTQRAGALITHISRCGTGSRFPIYKMYAPHEMGINLRLRAESRWSKQQKALRKRVLI